MQQTADHGAQNSSAGGVPEALECVQNPQT